MSTRRRRGGGNDCIYINFLNGRNKSDGDTCARNPLNTDVQMNVFNGQLAVTRIDRMTNYTVLLKIVKYTVLSLKNIAQVWGKW